MAMFEGLTCASDASRRWRMKHDAAPDVAVHDARRVHGRRRLEEPDAQFREFARAVGVQPQLAPGPCGSQYPNGRIGLEQMVM